MSSINDWREKYRAILYADADEGIYHKKWSTWFRFSSLACAQYAKGAQYARGAIWKYNMRGEK